MTIYNVEFWTRAKCNNHLVLRRKLNKTINGDSQCLKNKCLKLGYINARSVKNKSNELCDYIKDHELDGLAITETWLTKRDESITEGKLTPPGYKLHHVPRNNGRGGGVALLLRSSVSCAKIKTPDTHYFECIELLLKTKKKSFRVVVVYRPPSGSIDDFIHDFTEYMDSHATTNGHLVVLGDFNIHWDTNLNTAVKFKQALYSLNLTQHVTAPTHIKGHTLDLIITRAQDDIISPVTHHPPVMSDHQPLIFHLQAPKLPPEKKKISFRKIKEIDEKKFQHELSQSPLITSPSSTLDGLVSQYESTLSTLLDAHAPVITREVLVRHHTPWFNEDVQAAKWQRRQAERRWRKSPIAVNLELLREARSHVNNVVRKAKVTYYQKNISENQKDHKHIFKVSKSLLHKNNCISAYS